MNATGEVNSLDLNIVLAAFGSANTQADVTGDGVVGSFDLNYLLAVFGQSCCE